MHLYCGEILLASSVKGASCVRSIQPNKWPSYSYLRFTLQPINSPIEGAGVAEALDSDGGVTAASFNGAGVTAQIPHSIGYTAR